MKVAFAGSARSQSRSLATEQFPPPQPGETAGSEDTWIQTAADIIDLRTPGSPVPVPRSWLPKQRAKPHNAGSYKLGVPLLSNLGGPAISKKN